MKEAESFLQQAIDNSDITQVGNISASIDCSTLINIIREKLHDSNNSKTLNGSGSIRKPNQIQTENPFQF